MATIGALNITITGGGSATGAFQPSFGDTALPLSKGLRYGRRSKDTAVTGRANGPIRPTCYTPGVCGLKAYGRRADVRAEEFLEGSIHSEVDSISVLVMAPVVGSDLSFIADVDSRVRVLDGNAAYLAELKAQRIYSIVPYPYPDPAPPLQERDALLAQADVFLMAYPVLRHVASRAPQLRWVHQTPARVSNYWHSDLWASGITLTSGRGFVASRPIAEYVMAGAMFFASGLFHAYLNKRSGVPHPSMYPTQPLRGATMGIVGLGGIGKEVARLARLFSMRVLATRRSIQSPLENVDGADLILPADRLEELASQSDFLAVCAQLTRETQGLIDRRVFASMKPTSVLINVARGELVDEDALVQAVEGGQIRGAVLDVYRGELEGQPPRRELLDLPQVLLSPHISAGGADLREEAKDLFRENLRRFLDGEQLINVVDRGQGY